MIITLEGVDRAGKSTQAAMLIEWMRSKGYTAESFEFPDYLTPAGRRISEHLRAGDADLRTLHALMAENRREKAGEIRRAIADAHVLVIDRYVESNLAYGAANGLEREWLAGLDAGMPKADAVILLDMDAAESFRRGGDRDRFESDRAFLERVVAEYRNEVRQDAEGRWYKVAATGDVADVRGRVAACAKEAVSKAQQEGRWTGPP